MVLLIHASASSTEPLFAAGIPTKFCGRYIAFAVVADAGTVYAFVVSSFSIVPIGAIAPYWFSGSAASSCGFLYAPFGDILKLQ